MSKAREKSYFTLLAAVSLDGRITRGASEGSGWTSKEDKAFFRRELDSANAVIMGRKTFQAIKRPLKPRNRIVFTRSSFVKQKLPRVTRQHLFQYSQEFENRSDKLIGFCGSLERLRGILKKYDWKRIAVVGGTSVYDWFLKQDSIDEIYLTLEPVILGTGKPFSSRKLYTQAKFKLISVRKLNSQGTLLLHYKKLVAPRISK